MLEQTIVWLSAERPRKWLLLVAGIIGLSFALLVLGWDGINGTNSYWNTTHNDTLQGIAALRYYLREPWSMPLLNVPDYGVPIGTNLITADSIPLLAVPTKFVQAYLPSGFHYFGYWMALCFVLQPIAMVSLLVNLRIRHYTGAIAGSVMALLQTALLARYFHVSLMGQFGIIVALSLGIRMVRGENALRRMWQLGCLLVAIYFVHLYLFAMVIAVSLGFVIQAAVGRVVTWKAAAGFVGAIAFVAWVLVLGTGMGGAISYKVAGFGFHSMNALALLGNFDATGGQYEGYAYLGGGVVALLAVVAVMARDVYQPLVRRYWVPLLVVLLMAVYAMSTSVKVGYAFDFEIPKLAPIEWLGFRFRSSGRFVWPLVYVLVAGGIAIAAKRFKAKAMVMLLMGATVTQLIAMAPATLDLRRAMHATEQQVLATESWTAIVDDFDLVWTSPHRCIAADPLTESASRELQRIAARAGVPVTAAAVARRETSCDDPLPMDSPDPGELRVVWDTLDGKYSVPGATCVQFDLGTACTRTGSGVDELGRMVQS